MGKVATFSLILLSQNLLIILSKLDYRCFFQSETDYYSLNSPLSDRNRLRDDLFFRISVLILFEFSFIELFASYYSLIFCFSLNWNSLDYFFIQFLLKIIKIKKSKSAGSHIQKTSLDQFEIIQANQRNTRLFYSKRKRKRSLKSQHFKQSIIEIKLILQLIIIWMDKRAEKWGVKMLYSQMEPQVEFEAKHVINHAVENRSNEQEMAEQIKKYMDKKFYGGWFVVCGRNFGLDVTHEQGSFLRASKGPIEFIIFRCSS